MSGTTHFDCYPSDFLTGVKGLEAHLIGVYTVIFMMQYDTGEPVPYIGRERSLAGPLLMTRARFVKIVAELVGLGKLQIEDGCLTNRRTVKELGKIRAKSAQNLENGKIGGEMTKQKYLAKSNGNPNGNNDPDGRPPKRSPGQTPERSPGQTPGPNLLPSTKEEITSSTSSDPARESAAAEDFSGLEVRCCQAAGLPTGLPGFGEIVALALSGVSIDGRILPAIRRICVQRIGKPRGRSIETWFYFLPAIREQREVSAPKLTQVPRVFVTLGSPAWRAWEEHHRQARTIMPGAVHSAMYRANGYWFVTELPPSREAAA